MGMKMPPARAVVEGIAGARNASAIDSPYARPSVLFPQAATNMLATLSPRPVFWKPCSDHSSDSVAMCREAGPLLEAMAEVSSAFFKTTHTPGQLCC